MGPPLCSAFIFWGFRGFRVWGRTRDKAAAVALRLGRVHIDGCARDMPRPQRLRKRAQVNHRPSRGVDQVAAQQRGKTPLSMT